MARPEGNSWLATLRKPPRLQRGDRVMIVSPSWGGPATFPARYEAGKRQLSSSFGLEIVEAPHALADADWLYRNPLARADDLMRAFSDASVNGVIASIGGDDSIRLIPHLDLAVIAANPKAFVGYSDATTIHFACMKAGVASFHGPTIMSGFAENGGVSPLTDAAFRRALFEADPIGPLPHNTEGWTAEHLPWSDPANQEKPRRRAPSDGVHRLRGEGRVRGRLIGGCAEVLEMLKATALWPPPSHWDGAILFYETSEEAPSDVLVLRWLRNFAAQGILSRLSGLLLARPGGDIDEARREAQKAAVLRALDEAGLPELPVLADLDFGHTDPIATLPYGAMAEIDCDSAGVRILDSAVCA
jgi:muramoyltetrapeptide carboxypeptidase LdcA involved in peptidoglycan recycling